MNRVESVAARLPVPFLSHPAALCTSLHTSVNIVYLGQTDDLMFFEWRRMWHIHEHAKTASLFLQQGKLPLKLSPDMLALLKLCDCDKIHAETTPKPPTHLPLHHLIRTHARSRLHPVPPRPLSHSPNTALTAVEQLACDVTQIESF